MTASQQSSLPTFTEHSVSRGGGNLYVRDFAGRGTPYVQLHGFPDSAQIYDDLIPHLVAAGRRRIALLGSAHPTSRSTCAIASSNSYRISKVLCPRSNSRPSFLWLTMQAVSLP